MSLLPNRQASDEDVSTYKMEHPPETQSTSKVKKVLEKHKGFHTALLVLVLLGTCMVVGDGLLTPAISGIVCSPSWFFQFSYLEFVCLVGNVFSEKGDLHSTLFPPLSSYHGPNKCVV